MAGWVRLRQISAVCWNLLLMVGADRWSAPKVDFDI